MSRRTELKAQATVINLIGVLANVGAVIHFYGKSDVYILNLMVAIFCGILMLFNFFGWMASAFDDDVERNVRRLSGK